MNIFATKHYSNRLGRNQYAAELIRTHFPLSEEVLNVGGSAANHLKSLMPNRTITAVDIDPKADIEFDLDSDDQLPVKEKKPDLIVALDVLEHLEKFHERLDEILDLASDGIIVSLPISSSETARILLRPSSYRRKGSTEATFSKYYGLPLERPEDRHRWYIYGSDILQLAASLEKRGYVVHVGFDTLFKSKALSNLIITFFGRHLLPNLISKWVWLVVTKPSLRSEKP